jgi:hypothetical protein
MSEAPATINPKRRRNRETRVGIAPKTAEEITGVVLRADGAISRLTMERLALFMIEGIEDHAAWKLIKGKAAEGGSIPYRKAMTSHPVFLERMKMLSDERAAYAEDKVFGELKWMAAQMWREGRATNNASMMQKAADMRMKIMEKETAALDSVPGGRPGKPSVENPQTKTDVSDLRQRLLQAGVPAPGTVTGQSPVSDETASNTTRIRTSNGGAESYEVGPDTVVFPTEVVDVDAALARIG